MAGGDLRQGSLEKLMKAGSPVKNAFWKKKKNRPLITLRQLFVLVSELSMSTNS